MKMNTMVHSFGLISIFILFSVVGQFLFSSIAKDHPASIYRVFPVTSIPLIVQFLQHGPQTAKEPAARKVTVVLENGSRVTGTLTGEESGWVVLRVDGSDVGFRRSEIVRIEE